MDFLEHADDFRSLLPNVDAEGKRKWLFPMEPKGKWTQRRNAVTVLLLSVFFGLPLIQYKGEPFFLLNFLDRKFILFGTVFWPQDTLYLLMAALIFFVFILLFTTAFGRIWCGWACPQTLFMERVFRRIEYLIEGSAAEQKRLAAAPWGKEKWAKKTLKHLVFYAIALLIGHTFMAYIVGFHETIGMLSAGPGSNSTGFFAIIGFSTLFYLVFSQLRELACTIICPYGRLQGALVGPQTLHVVYDELRGEPRGKQAGAGDCVNCVKCVAVCPTGIDIRNGIQLDCVNCTACIDACDGIMDKLGRPKGLIRYGSQQGLKTGEPLKMDARKWGYTAVLAVLVSAFVLLLATRSDVEATLTRVPGQLYSETPQGTITNMYKLQLVNKTRSPLPVTIELSGAGQVRFVGNAQPQVAGQEKMDAIVLVEIPRTELKKRSTDITLFITTGNERQKLKTRFNAPN